MTTRFVHYDPRFEAIVYDTRDARAVDPSSSVGWFGTLDDATKAIHEYVQAYPMVERFEVRDYNGKLHLSGTVTAGLTEDQRDGGARFEANHTEGVDL